MRIAIKFALVAMLLVSFANAQERASEKEIIQAFLDCPEIIKAQKEIGDTAGLGISMPRVVLGNSGCGVAGCQGSLLVAQKYEERRANPWTTHILGVVHLGFKGEIVKVERVELIPFKELKETRRDGKE